MPSFVPFAASGNIALFIDRDGVGLQVLRNVKINDLHYGAYEWIGKGQNATEDGM